MEVLENTERDWGRWLKKVSWNGWNKRREKEGCNVMK